MSTLDERTVSHANTIKSALNSHIETMYKSDNWFSDEVDKQLNQSIGSLSETVMNVLYQAVAEKDRQSPEHAACRIEDGNVQLDVNQIVRELALLSAHVPEMNQITVNLVNAHYNAHCRGEHGADYSDIDVAGGVAKLLANDNLNVDPASIADFIGEMRAYEKETGNNISGGWGLCDKAISDTLDPQALAASLPPRAPETPKRDVPHGTPDPQRPKR
jgi:hypothetical protein